MVVAAPTPPSSHASYAHPCSRARDGIPSPPASRSSGPQSDLAWSARVWPPVGVFVYGCSLPAHGCVTGLLLALAVVFTAASWRHGLRPFFLQLSASSSTLCSSACVSLLPWLKGYNGGWTTCSGREVEEALLMVSQIGGHLPCRPPARWAGPRTPMWVHQWATTRQPMAYERKIPEDLTYAPRH